ncbi:hypothetical protein ACFLQ6_04965 [Thermoproteota archaeon]
MNKLLKFVLSSILIIVIVLGLNNPVEAQPPSPKISLKPNLVYVTPCSNFIVEVWITDIPSGWMMTGFGLEMYWDPEYMELAFPIGGDVSGDYFKDFYVPRGWNGGIGADEEEGRMTIVGWASNETTYWATDSPWLSIEFHCLEAGISPLLLQVWYERDPGPAIEITDGDVIIDVEPEPFEMDVHQIFPVGGISLSTNKLEILTPYLALAGLIIAISSVYVFKRRKD